MVNCYHGNISPEYYSKFRILFKLWIQQMIVYCPKRPANAKPDSSDTTTIPRRNNVRSSITVAAVQIKITSLPRRPARANVSRKKIVK